MLSEKGEFIFKRKYALNEDETWEQACVRVASHVASILGDSDDFKKYMKEFYQIIANLYFLPGGRILKNSGTDIKNLFNCFYINIEDSRDSIYKVLKDSAEIFAWGGGLGTRISDLREEGAEIKTSNTESSGPLSFMKLFNLTGEIIQQASRRGAQIALMDISHPDIIKFLELKSKPTAENYQLLKEMSANSRKENIEFPNRDVVKRTLVENQFTHFNISVEISDKFMEAVMEDADWNLISPSTGEVKDTIKARNLLKRIAKQIWLSGDPGLFFTDAVCRDNMVPYVSNKLGCNPCAEINLISYEPCNLGSINLHRLYDKEIGGIDLEKLTHIVATATLFLTFVHGVSSNRVEEVNKMAQGLRRIGIGVMGFADLLLEMGVPYDSDEAVEIAETLSAYISYISWMTSASIAENLGTFPMYDKEKVDLHVIDKLEKSSANLDMSALRKLIEENGLANVSTTAIAPTGSIALLADVSSSIEPVFGLAYTRYITDGESNKVKEKIIEVNPIFISKLKEAEIDEETVEKIVKYAEKNGSIQNCKLVPNEIKKVFVTALDIEPSKHILMQSAWQKYISNAISKTINLPESATETDIYNSIIELWKMNVKSSTLYRDGSKYFQILNVGSAD